MLSYGKPIRILLLTALVSGLAGTGSAIDLENHPGKAIYQRLCLDCHDWDGNPVEGVDSDPLVGNRSLESLAGRIERTMPEDEEHLCVGEDAKTVAEFVYHAFYSAEAQARKNDVRTDLTRLTAPQLQNSVTDLIGGFYDANHPHVITKFGLRGDYTLDDRKRAGNNDFERVRFNRDDPLIRFDYGTGVPKLPDDVETDLTQFRVTWKGSIFARESGIYEFTIRTRNGAKLWINEQDDKKEPVIDAWVAPNNEIREQSGKIHLLGGRRYFLRLDFFRYQEAKSLIELLWKTPHGVRETVPNSVLSTEWSHPQFISTTPLPADDRSFGYERGSNVSRVWFDAVTSVAFEAADYVDENLDRLARIKRDDPERSKKVRDFARAFAERANRRPLTSEQVESRVNAHFKEADSEKDAIRRIVLQSITSPQFLYPSTAFDSPDDQWAKASALALAFWDSVPDRRLRESVEKGELPNPKEVEKRARRMVWDGRTRYKLQGFFHHWLELSKADDVAKDESLFPQFSPELMADLRKSLDLFIDEIVWSDQSDYRQLLLSDQLFLNPRLGKIYGKDNLEGSFQKVSFPNQGRTGVITHPYLLTNLAYHNNTSPIHRGVFLTRNIVGLPLKPPPEAIEFEDSKFPPNLTMREKVTEMTRAKACMACHSTINPLGFSLEQYDAIGRWRQKERGKPINDDSVLETDYGNRIDIKGPRDVAEYAANSPAAHEAFVRQLYHHVAKQPLLAYGPDTASHLEKRFRDRNYHILHLLVDMAVTATSPLPPTPTDS